MSYLAIYTAANDPDFQARCKVALWKAAYDITNEDPQTVNHEARLNWARTVQQGRLALTDATLAQAVLTNTTIAANPSAASDGDIQFQVSVLLACLIAQG